jgi:3-oxoacyl-[acyl-carrier-protein] synthase-3
VTAVSLLGTASYMPERVVDNAYFGLDTTQARGAMFRGSKLRHHVSDDETALAMITRASQRLGQKLDFDLSKVDILLGNVTCLDMPFTGCGASVASHLGARPRVILDIHNAGCVSFVYMMAVARALITAGEGKTALIYNVQNAAGRVFAHPENRARPQSAVPGDGCGVGLVVAGDQSPIEAIVTHAHGEYADDMRVVSDDGQPWWSPRTSPLYIDFTEDRVASIVGRGNRLVPEVVKEACKQANLPVKGIDVLVTNQPNPTFLRNWREALQVPADRHVHTYDEHGNLFGAALPISLERAVDTGRLKPGQRVVLGGFAHAGDYSAAAVVHWRPSA